MISEPGIYLDMDAAEYFADPCPQASLTQSIAKVLLDHSPQHAWLKHTRLNPKYQPGDEGYEKDRIIGSAAHAMFTNRGVERVKVLDFTNFRTKDAQEVRDECLDKGLIPILPHHYQQAEEMVAAAWDQLEERGFPDTDVHYDGEVVIAWREGSLWFRSMIDLLQREHRRIIIDYKTTAGSAAPHTLGAKMADSGWDIQAAMHERGLDVLDPDNAGRRRHLFVVQENTEPYALSIAEMTEAGMTFGRKQLEAAINAWSPCMAANAWPLYPLDIVRPEYPGWKATSWLNREMADAEREPPHDNVNILIAG